MQKTSSGTARVPLLHPATGSENTNEQGSIRGVDPRAEWLEADGLGGFASGTVSGVRNRRYHALLLSARRPPGDRFVLVNGFEAEVHTPLGTYPISSQHYTPDVVAPDGARRLEAFGIDPWPTWRYRVADNLQIRQEIFVPKDRAVAMLRFTLLERRGDVHLEVRPFLSGRDYHSLHHENPVFRFEAIVKREEVRFAPYPGVPEILLRTNGSYHSEPHWYRSFLYESEEARGLDSVEDLAAPGKLVFDLSAGPAVVILASSLSDLDDEHTAMELFESFEASERSRRAAFRTPLHRSADAFLVRRGSGSSIIAGYPWFTDWGRDTFISLRGLCLAGGRVDVARTIIGRWASEVRDGMLPNFFPDGSREPEFNSVDAPLWFIVAAHELLQRSETNGFQIDEETSSRVREAIEQVLVGYASGTRYRIGLDPEDGLLRAGEEGVQLTWMDAKVGDWVVTPRIGKPVEIEALWLNALAVGALSSERWKSLLERGEKSFQERFWNEKKGCLFDVIDVGHRSGEVDASVRPNQLLAVGGLPRPLLAGERARSIVECAERVLLTPNGLRSLAPGEPGYAAHYQGGPRERDGAYHQGTAWPWLLGPFVEAWVRVRGGTATAKREAYRRFVAPMEQGMFLEGGLGHLSEIADAEEPYQLRGCPFQAWSLGELMRLKFDVLSEA